MKALITFFLTTLLLVGIAGAQPVLTPPVLTPPLENAPNPSRLVNPCVFFVWDTPSLDFFDSWTVWIASPPGSEFKRVGGTIPGPRTWWRVCNEEYNTLYEMRVEGTTEGGDVSTTPSSIPFKWIRSADFNHDHTVGFSDFGIFLNRFGIKDNGTQER